MKQKVKKHNFSIFEVLIVITILSILASLIVSSMGMAREEANRTSCLNNLKQIQLVFESFRKDHQEVPEAFVLGDLTFASDYVLEKDLDMFVCPGDEYASMSSVADLLYGSSYYYIPSEEVASRMRGIDEAIGTFLVIYDKNKDFHNGKINIVYLHGSSSNAQGIAQTYNPEITNDIDIPLENNKGKNPNDGGETRNNHGHGNNVDSVDKSNPGKAPKDDSDDTIDDEIKDNGNAPSKSDDNINDETFEDYVDAVNSENTNN